MSRAVEWLTLGAVLLTGISLSYGMALLQEPRAFWLWHNILGLI